METEPSSRTLLDEWQWRRDALSRSLENSAVFAGEQIRVLDFLIHRYRNAPEAQRPAAARLPADLCVNDRAIVVLHHLWKGKVGGVKTRQEARDRMSAILERMSSHASSTDTGDAEVPPEAMDDDSAAARGLWSQLYDTFYVSDYDPRIRGALDKHPRLAGILYRRMMQPETDDKRAAELLIQARNPAALRYAVHAWRELIGADRMNQAWVVLDRFLASPEPSSAVLEGIRESLCDGNAEIRMSALAILGDIGTLEDIGLLSDLLSLPAAADEHPDERGAMLCTMQKIAEHRHK